LSVGYLKVLRYSLLPRVFGKDKEIPVLFYNFAFEENPKGSD